MAINNQAEKWAGDFGDIYFLRNLKTYKETDEMSKELWGVSRSEMNTEFVGHLDRNIRILEIGTQTGNQLMLLKQMGFKNLYGIEINKKVIEKSKEMTSEINIIYGEGEDIPFKDGFFNLVCTSGVLIHVHPDNLGRIMDEIYRCTNRFIWGFEYFEKDFMKIKYHGNDELLWKGDYAGAYLNRFKDLKLVKENKYKYLNVTEHKFDSMFLLSKE